MRRRKRSIWDVLAAFCLFVVVALIAAWLESRNAEIVEAPMRVLDGDSLAADNIKIRLVGIDAPELKQICQRADEPYLCGVTSKAFLRKLISDALPVSCTGDTHDKYGRLLAECFAGDVNLNRQMVSAGWAISYGGYGGEEAIARLQKRGLWAGKFDRPDRWRAVHGGMIEAEHGAMFDRLRQWVLGLMKGENN